VSLDSSTFKVTVLTARGRIRFRDSGFDACQVSIMKPTILLYVTKHAEPPAISKGRERKGRAPYWWWWWWVTNHAHREAPPRVYRIELVYSLLQELWRTPNLPHACSHWETTSRQPLGTHITIVLVFIFIFIYARMKYISPPCSIPTSSWLTTLVRPALGTHYVYIHTSSIIIWRRQDHWSPPMFEEVDNT
jgi:hypothetical protein